MRSTPLFRRAAGLAILGSAGAATACDDLLTESPPHVVTADNLYSSPTGFQNGLNALYHHVRREFGGMSSADGFGGNAPPSLFTRTGVDNAIGDNDDAPRVVNIANVRMTPTQDLIFRYWNQLYDAINAANTLVTRAEDANLAWTETEKNRVIAEGRVIRAWAYRHLAYLWGGVPLNLEESSGASIRTDWERAPLEQVQGQIEQDLLFAEEHLPEVPERDGRVSRAVAQHFLAELYLWMGDDPVAEQKADAIINSGSYQLNTERYGVTGNQPGSALLDQFQDGSVLRSQGNTEVLWALEYEQNVPGGGEHINRRNWASTYHSIPGLAVSVEHGGRGQRRAFPTRWAVELYCFGDSQPGACLDPDNPKSRSPDDVRGDKHTLRRFYIYNNPTAVPAGRSLGDTLWLRPKPEDVDAHDQISTRKWDWADPENLGGSESYGDIPYVRLAETHLLAAEAEMKQGKLAEAADHINALRRRAHAEEITPDQVTLDFILDERSRELLAEEQRRYTLVRTGTLGERLRLHNPWAGPSFQDHNVLFPIPQAVIDANLDRELSQNPGY